MRYEVGKLGTIKGWDYSQHDKWDLVPGQKEWQESLLREGKHGKNHKENKGLEGKMQDKELEGSSLVWICQSASRDVDYTEIRKIMSSPGPGFFLPSWLGTLVMWK